MSERFDLFYAFYIKRLSKVSKSRCFQTSPERFWLIFLRFARTSIEWAIAFESDQAKNSWVQGKSNKSGFGHRLSISNQ
jgi:hypothetical protein